jgi:uncharacterized protein (DUF4415 family)
MKKKIQRSRSQTLAPVLLRPLVTLWLDYDVAAYYLGTGRGWQSRINAVLRKAAKLPKEKKRV